MAKRAQRNKSEPANSVSPDRDLVTLFHSVGTDGVMQADAIHAILESNGIYSLESGIVYPGIGFAVKVARADLEKAQRALQDAEANGSEAAEQAEAISETEK
ncbi:MAG: hypothetical protein WBE86_05680 [Candidatus Acidiferrales bacterium]